MVDAPASPSAASRSLARRRNECTRQGRLWLPGPARRAGPRVAAQAVTLARTPDALLPGWRAQAVGRRFGRIVRTERRSRGPVSGLRAPPPADCRKAGILQYCAVSASRCRSGQRRGAAELGWLASGAVTPGEPGANRQPGRPRPPPQPAGATMRSSRRLRGRGSLAAVRSGVPRPPSRSSAATAGLQRGPGPRGRPSCSRSPQFRCAYRPPACCTCLAVMPRLLAYCLGDGS
jgi:hypothetical protein